jgi:hypothetical protein
MDDTTETSDRTTAAEEAEAGQAHVADRPPTTEEAAAADRSRVQFREDADQVATHEEEMAEKGAHVKGEGEIA